MMTALVCIAVLLWLGGLIFHVASGDWGMPAILWPCFVVVGMLVEWRSKRRLRKLLREAWRR